jgi:predicted dehydrogenase
MADMPMIMVGGGAGSLIGPVHRAALARDNSFTLSGGLFSSDADRSATFGAGLGLDPDACRGSLTDIVARVRGAHPSRPIAASVCTPNDTHAEICGALLALGVHVMCDKPLVQTPAEIDAVARAALSGSSQLAVTYTLSAYPMIRQARDLVERGEIGEVRQVAVEYLQGQLFELVEADAEALRASARLRWRLAPDRAGPALVLQDIGSHAFHLATFVTGTSVESLCADLGPTVPGRVVEDYAGVLLRFGNGARGTLSVTQAASGLENEVRLRVSGSRGTLEWRHGDAQHLYLSRQREPQQRFSAGSPATSDLARAASILPPGHPQGFIDAFAVLYRELRQAIEGARPATLPGLDDGAACVRFIETAIASTQQRGWVSL